jgi:hypothetical protein
MALLADIEGGIDVTISSSGEPLSDLGLVDPTSNRRVVGAVYHAGAVKILHDCL